MEDVLDGVLWHFASSLDQAGPMTKDVKDSAIIIRSYCQVMIIKDSTSAQ